MDIPLIQYDCSKEETVICKIKIEQETGVAVLATVRKRWCRYEHTFGKRQRSGRKDITDFIDARVQHGKKRGCPNAESIESWPK